MPPLPHESALQYLARIGRMKEIRELPSVLKLAIQRGAIWGCEVCESKHFCTACFKERFGSQRFLDMTQNDPLIMCPDCYGIIRYNPRHKGGQYGERISAEWI